MATQTQAWTVHCPPPPKSITEGYACEKIKGKGADRREYACLFNIAEDPCEHVDLSQSHPHVLNELWTRLEAYRATAVPQGSSTPNPDGHNCPRDVQVPNCGEAGAQAPLNCHATVPCA